MSYCVNCGVELEKSIKQCPLCGTPVINPNNLDRLKEIQSPYPEKKGVVERASRKDLIILISVFFGCTALSCGLLNYFVYNTTKWSLFVIGFCGIMWMLLTPPLIVANLKKRVFALLIGLTICVYIGLIGVFLDSYAWVIELAIPITVIFTLMVEILLSIGKKTKSMLILSSTIFAEIAFFCISIELLVRRFIGKSLDIHWSSIVLTVCVVLIVAFVTILSRSRIRSQLHRRFHL